MSMQDSRLKCPHSHPDGAHYSFCFWARHFTLTVPLYTQLYLYIPKSTELVCKVHCMDAALVLGNWFSVCTGTVCHAIEHVVAISWGAICTVNLNCWWRIDNLLTYSSFFEIFVRKRWPRICEILTFLILSVWNVVNYMVFHSYRLTTSGVLFWWWLLPLHCTTGSKKSADLFLSSRCVEFIYLDIVDSCE